MLLTLVDFRRPIYYIGVIWCGDYLLQSPFIPTDSAFQAFWLVATASICGMYPQLLVQRTVSSVPLTDVDGER